MIAPDLVADRPHDRNSASPHHDRDGRGRHLAEMTDGSGSVPCFYQCFSLLLHRVRACEIKTATVKVALGRRRHPSAPSAGLPPRDLLAARRHNYV